ncbi:pentapeptide repeat-containing protein [Pelosinus fermentans]|uniref:Pentapeptide repeat protein n=1 Tax=Pelosinus fermentans JBW45 TaxID=1192197 RepID=I9NTK1_9FIRM|nr:pentapeptide repeat-containing protein [Pelosinus fermentans]AJQ28049.1 hypothetical protein JBW_02705 [Pelosinus fermentans JBW45]
MGQEGILKKMTQEDFNQILEEQQDGLQINFKYCDLSGLDLSGRKFECVKFEDCNLSGVNFSETIIKQGEFKNGLLIGGNFEKADLSTVDFTGCAMQKVNLSHVRIEGVGIKESNLANASFKSANVEFSDLNVFKDVNLSDADLSGSKISWFYGENVNFRHANFNEASIIESQMKGCKFMNASLENADLYSVAFKDCEMQESVLAKAKITNVTFEKSTLENMDFKQSEIEYGRFADCNLDGVDFRAVTLSSLNEFRNVSLINADFSEAKFSDESKLYDVNAADVKGLDFSPLQSSVKEQGNVAVASQQDKESLTMQEYQYRLNLFVARNVGSEVNAKVDCEIAQTMLEQGYSSQLIESVIALYSPKASEVGNKARVYAMNVVKKAEKENMRR